MTASTTGIRGEYRRMLPAVIGKIVRNLRTERNLKRSSLARDAKISEKTLERIESGQKVRDDNYRRLAAALELPPEIFIESFYHPTEAEFAEKLTRYDTRIREENEEVAVQVISDPRDILAIVQEDAFIFDSTDVDLKDAEAAAALHDSLAEFANIYAEISEVDRLRLARQLFAELRALELLGYIAKRSVRSVIRRDRISSTSVMTIKIWDSRNRSSLPKSVWVPRRLDL